MINLIDFIKSCTDCWHTADTTSKILSQNGFVRLGENEDWQLSAGGKYYVMRNMSSLIAFKMPKGIPEGFMICAAHGESPSFKIKPTPELSDGKYIRLSTEVYGGPQLSSWLDRPLSVSGRVALDIGSGIETRLVRLDRDSLIIPSLAAHISKDKEINIARDMPPLYALADGASFTDELAEAAGCSKDKISGFDLMLYNRESGRVWGKNDEFISAPRLDDLQCVYALLGGFLESDTSSAVQVFCMFDNEEVGSGTKQGAKSDFLPSSLRRICEAQDIGYSRYMQLLAASFMVSADNGHAIHPNRPDASDSANYPEINKGVVIKYNASQRYTTDGVSEAIFKKLCKNADVPYQVYANRSDIPGGSTLGNLAAEKTCINTVDAGLAQLAMHSAYETAGNLDTEYMKSAIREFLNSSIKICGDKYIIE